MKQITITVGIPALNEGGNILSLLSSLTYQKISCGKLTNILLISDGSVDDTVTQACLCRDQRLKIVDGEIRLGKAARLNEIIRRTNTDVLVLMDGDIAIPRSDFLERLVRPVACGDASLSSASLKEITPRNYFESVLYVSMRLKENLFAKFKNGDNVYNCHGPARALSKKFYKDISFGADNAEDMHSYLCCVYRGLRFKFVSEAAVYYRLPDNLHDYLKQSTRYHSSQSSYPTMYERTFVEKELNIPLSTWIAATVVSIPLIARNLVRVGLYVVVLSIVRLRLIIFGPMREMWSVSSSKIYS